MGDKVGWATNCVVRVAGVSCGLHVARMKGTRFGVQVAGNDVFLEKEATDMMRDYGGRVGTVFSTCEKVEKGYRHTDIICQNKE